MRILILLVLGMASLMAAPKLPPVPKRKAPVRQNSSKGAAGSRAKAHAAAAKNKPAIAARNAKKPPARPKVYHKK
jgi:hypothetical protein